MILTEINNRYSELAESTCCLSCGGAINHAEAVAGEVCVDLGSGRGTDVIRLAESVGNDGFVYGIDISDGMIQKAKSTAAKLGV
jgi:ubiquinone/menaquinone biosynthesis C-methylase UbiE